MFDRAELDFDTPSAAWEAGIRRMRDGRTKYSKATRIKPFRKKVHESFTYDHGPNVDEITAACGTKQVENAFVEIDKGQMW